MKNLGKIFKKHWRLILGILLGLLVLIFFSPFKKLAQWLGISNDKYEVIAYNLFMAMQGAGTREDEILRLLRPLSAWELERVYQVFGGNGREGYGFWGSIGPQYTLFEWFKAEFSPLWDKKKLEELRDLWSKTSLEIIF